MHMKYKLHFCSATRRTQGPACSVAAGPATVYRNYFAPVKDVTGQVLQEGQSRDCQINNLLEVCHNPNANANANANANPNPNANANANRKAAVALSNLAINRQNQMTIAEALGVTGIDQGWERIVDEAMHRAATGAEVPKEEEAKAWEAMAAGAAKEAQGSAQSNPASGGGGTDVTG